MKQQICLIPEEYQIYEIKSIGFGNKKQDFPLRGVFIYTTIQKILLQNHNYCYCF